MPINNITQTISELPAAGKRGIDVQTIFVTKQEDFQDHLQGITVTELNALVEQQNTMAGAMNSTATQVNTNANTATTQAGIATTKASGASTSASQALTSRNQAETFAQQASASALSVDANNLVYRRGDATVNVGAGQTYTTINQALEYLSGFYPMYKKSGVSATINLKAGFVMAEQVLVSGIDLGWIIIIGEDAETIITHTALTTSFNGTNYPAFGVDKGGTSPIIGQLFRFDVEKAGGNKHGLMTYGAGSSSNILPNKGFIGVGTYGVYALESSTINASGANCSNAGANGMYASQASTINANGANCSNVGTNGMYASQASTINASGANCSNAGTYGVYALELSIITANGANCSNAGTNGINATQSSIISAYDVKVQNQTTGTARISVAAGSHIEATLINTTGGTVAVFSQAVNTLTSNGIIYQ